MAINCLKYFPASIVSAASNLQPIYSLFLASCMVNEKATVQDITSIAITLFSIFLIMKSQVQQDLGTSDPLKRGLGYKLAICCLFIFPLLAAAGTVVRRQIKSVTPIALAACSQTTLMVISSIAIVATIPEEGFSTSMTFGVFGLISLIAVFSVSMMILLYVATRHLTVNRLSVFMQLSLLLQIFVDIKFLGFTF